MILDTWELWQASGAERMDGPVSRKLMKAIKGCEKKRTASEPAAAAAIRNLDLSENRPATW